MYSMCYIDVEGSIHLQQGWFDVETLPRSDPPEWAVEKIS